MPSSSSRSGHLNQLSENRFILLFVACLLIGQFGLFLADPNIQFYWSDSRYYMFSILDERISRSRPVFYGYVIELLWHIWPRPASIVLFQILLFCATCAMFAVILRRYFAKPRSVVLFVTLIVSLLPAHMIWTRYVMTETTFLFLLTLFLLVSLEFIRSGRIVFLFLAVSSAVIAIGFRWSIIPIALLVPIALPALKWIHDRLTGIIDSDMGQQHAVRWTAKRGMLVLAISLGFTIALHAGYQYSNSRLVIGNYERPAYAYRNGFFLLGFLSPLVKKEDIPAELDRDFIWNAVKIKWGDRHERERHRWDGRGIVRQLQYYVLNHPELDRSTNEVAQEIAIAAVVRDPGAFIKLAFLTLTDFWNRPLFEKHIRHDLVIRWGPNFPEQDFVEEIQQKYGYDAIVQQDNVTFLKSFFLALQDYLALISLSFLTVPIVIAFQEKRTWVYFMLVAFVLAYFGASSIALTSWPNARYMQVVSWLTVLALASFAPDWSRLASATRRLRTLKASPVGRSL